MHKIMGRVPEGDVTKRGSNELKTLKKPVFDVSCCTHELFSSPLAFASKRVRSHDGDR